MRPPSLRQPSQTCCPRRGLHLGIYPGADLHGLKQRNPSRNACGISKIRANPDGDEMLLIPHLPRTFSAAMTIKSVHAARSRRSACLPARV